MLLLKIANKSSSSHNHIISTYTKHLLHSNKMLKFVTKETLSFYVR